MSNMLENLSWLMAAPDDFLDRLNNVADEDDLFALSKFSLSDIHLHHVADRLSKLKKSKGKLTKLQPIKLGIVSNTTTNYIASSLVGTAVRYSLDLEVIESEFNQVGQLAFGSDDIFKGEDVDVVLVSIDHRGLPLGPDLGVISNESDVVNRCYEYILSIVKSLQQKTGSKIILQNMVPPFEYFAGSFERRLSGTKISILNHLNSKLDDLKIPNVYVMDIHSLASQVGFASWHDPKYWNLAKVSFSMKYIPIFCEFLCRILSASMGRARRVLILDLDNTCWGGVIGDDGIEGIVIGNGNPTGEAYLHVQRMALELRARGIVLAVSSKNEDYIAKRPFNEHPDMILKEDHIAVFQANWQDKASNIRLIADKLSLGLDSFVFLDDNPAERLQVRTELPTVAVPELPNDPALYVSTLIAAGYFETVNFSDEDSQRADYYAANLKREEASKSSSNMDQYLASLDMEIIFKEFDGLGRSRISQLINKSNQFNLTTKRYTESEIKIFEEDPNYFTRQVRLTDCFGDNGMISTIICRIKGEDWIIDTWLMSCRVLGRRVEIAVLNELVNSARDSGAKRLIGNYIPSGRNFIVEKHYEQLGFSLISKNNDNHKWELKISNYENIDVPMKVTHAV